MKVIFRCKLSGNTVSFVNPLDIECLRKDFNYDEVKDEIQAKTKSESSSNRPDDENERKERTDENEIGQKKVLKKRGRPANK